MPKEIDGLKHSSVQTEEDTVLKKSGNEGLHQTDPVPLDNNDTNENLSNKDMDTERESKHEETEHTEEEQPSTVFEIPQDVQELLEDVSKSNPAGADIESSEDDEAISILIDLEAEMEKRSGNDYNKCLGWAKALLEKYSKNLSVAIWLTISWFRVMGLSGLNKGLILLAELLNKYGEKCFPQNKEKQARMFNSLNNDPRLFILKKISFEEEIPVFKVTTEILESQRAKEELPRELLFKMTRFKERSFSGEKKFLDNLKNELFPKDEKKGKIIDQNEEKLLNIFRESKTDEEPTKFSVTDRFIKIIKTISDFKTYEDIFTDIKDEQFTSSERFIDELGQRFIDNNIELNFVNAHQQLFNCLGNNTIAHLLDLKDGYEHLKNTLESYFADNIPELSNLSELIGKLTTDAEKLVSLAVKNTQVLGDVQKSAEEKQVIQPETTPELKPTAPEIPVTEVKPTPSVVQKPPIERAAEGEISAQNLKITRETESIVAMKKALLFYFREEKTIKEENGNIRREKVLKVTSDPRVFGISRSLRWNQIKMPPNDSAEIGPDDVKQKYLQSKLNSGDVDTVIADFEANFIENEQLQFWLDGQRFVTQALEQKGADWKLCAQEIKFHLAKLLHRMPDLPKLTFKDKKTAYANPETQQWINEEVLNIMGTGKPQEKILPPILGEEYNSINNEYEKACEQPVENFEENAKLMQQAIAGDLRVKGKFLRKLCLANYCFWAKKYDLAHVLFDELVQHIEQYHIIEWEQALCVSVWQAMYKNNMKLLSMDNYADQKNVIENQNRDLIKKISKYDVVLALNLTKHEGE